MLGPCFLALCVFVLACNAQQQTPAESTGEVRQYFISADEVELDYAPHNMDHMTGKPFDKSTLIWVEKGKDRIGQVYRKAIYREYTDATFQTLKPREPEYEHMGILGPVIRAEVGDTIEIVFRNNTKQPYGMHPHGVSSTKDSEGAPYANMPPETTGLVAPGKTHKYIWTVPAANAEGLDKVNAALQAVMKGNPLGGPAIESMVDFSAHRDELARTNATYK